MTLGSLFDGIGGWQLAAIRAGILPIWSSEIEAFPLAVTKAHFPDTIQLGDITKIDSDTLSPVDIICAGSPCQDLSIAGTRSGFYGKQSGLFRTAVHLFHQLRRRTGKPRFFIWENVPGAFSSNKGRDFRVVLEEIGKTHVPMPDHGKWANAGVAELPHCEIAWRVLDAQYFGVAQRRHRIFLVADFARHRRLAFQILFEPQGVREPVETRRKPWKNTAERTRTKFTETDATSNINAYDPSHRNDVIRVLHGDKVNTLTARMGTGGHNVPLVQKMDKPKVYVIAGNVIGRKEKNGGNGRGFQEDKSYPLTSSDRHVVSIHKKALVRRITPLECERLQGLPDHYTNLKDTPCSDSARYKAIGNGMAQPCADFVLKRLSLAVGPGIKEWIPTETADQHRDSEKVIDFQKYHRHAKQKSKNQ